MISLDNNMLALCVHFDATKTVFVAVLDGARWSSALVPTILSPLLRTPFQSTTIKTRYTPNRTMDMCSRKKKVRNYYYVLHNTKIKSFSFDARFSVTIISWNNSAQFNMPRKPEAYSSLGSSKRTIIAQAKRQLDILARGEGTQLLADILNSKWGSSIKQVND